MLRALGESLPCVLGKEEPRWDVCWLGCGLEAEEQKMIIYGNVGSP